MPSAVSALRQVLPGDKFHVCLAPIETVTGAGVIPYSFVTKGSSDSSGSETTPEDLQKPPSPLSLL